MSHILCPQGLPQPRGTGLVLQPREDGHVSADSAHLEDKLEFEAWDGGLPSQTLPSAPPA